MPQHDDTFPDTSAIEAVRGPIRRLAQRFPDREPIDIALGAFYASYDLARCAGMDAWGAIEWMRTATDLIERQLLERQKAS